jgi:hypothetical protein
MRGWLAKNVGIIYGDNVQGDGDEGTSQEAV